MKQQPSKPTGRDINVITSRVKKLGAQPVLRKKAVVERLINRAKTVSSECSQQLLELAWEIGVADFRYRLKSTVFGMERVKCCMERAYQYRLPST